MHANRTLKSYSIEAISYSIEALLLLNPSDSFSFGNHRPNLFEKYTIEFSYGIISL